MPKSKKKTKRIKKQPKMVLVEAHRYSFLMDVARGVADVDEKEHYVLTCHMANKDPKDLKSNCELHMYAQALLALGQEFE